MSKSVLTLVLTGLLFTACGVLFENADSDPHPPAVVNLQFSPRNIASGELIFGSFIFVDDGGDVEILEMRDTSSAEAVTPVPWIPGVTDVGDEDAPLDAPFFFPGTTGRILWQLPLTSNQAGNHTIRVWVEDSFGTRSNVVEFVVNVRFQGT